MRYKKIHILFICLLFGFSIPPSLGQHNYELYNNGAVLHTSAGSTMYVLGDMHVLSTSTLENNGFIEVQGNLYGSNTFQQRGTGTVRLYNRTVNIGETQTIYGAGSFAVRGGYAQLGVNDGSFYNLELSNDLGAVYLSGGGYVADVRNSVDFNPLGIITNRIITSAPPPSAIPANGSLYPSIFGIMNTAGSGATTASTAVDMPNNTIFSNGFSSAIDNGYVQGKLRRAINPAGGTYGFIMGLEPSAAGPTKKGVQYSHMVIGANDYDVVTGYFQSGSDNTVAGYWNDCSGYLIDYFGGTDHGEWVYSQSGGTTGTFTMKVWPQNDAFPAQTVWLITQNNTIAGTQDDCGPSAVSLDRAGFTDFGEFGVAGSNTIDPLPIELIELSATPFDSHSIRVNWSTATETNVNHFEVERSTDAVNFNYIGTHGAAGNSTTVNNYQFDDVNCIENQRYYYRIKTVDNDNSFNNTTIVSAIIENTTFFGDNLMIYPNPMNGSHLEIQYRSQKEQNLQLKIVNSIGQLVLQQYLNATEGENHFHIIPTFMAKGLYFIEIEDSQHKNITRLKLVRS